MKRGFDLVGAAVACLVLGSGTQVAAYPIPPQTIWEVTEDAHLVVVARVMRIEPGKSAGDPRGAPDVAVLQVKEVWKGRALPQVRVSYRAGMACPAPPRFAPLLDVLAFLRIEKETQTLRVVGLSYGTLYLESR